MTLDSCEFDRSGRHYLTLSASVLLPMQLFVVEPRPFSDEHMRELMRQLAPLLKRFVRYDDAINGAQQRMVSLVDVESAFRNGSVKEHREGELWFAYTLTRADENNHATLAHVLQPAAELGAWHALDIVPWLLTVVVASSPKTLLAPTPSSMVGIADFATSKFFRTV